MAENPTKIHPEIDKFSKDQWREFILDYHKVKRTRRDLLKEIGRLQKGFVHKHERLMLALEQATQESTIIEGVAIADGSKIYGVANYGSGGGPAYDDLVPTTYALV